MAITAETRNDIIELVVTSLNQAPGTTLLTELVAIVDAGGSLADVADHLTASDAYKAIYPSFQTAEEFADEWLSNLVPEASADALAEAKSVAVGLINGGASQADLMLEAQAFLSALSESDASFGTSAANWNNRVEVATAHTITNETAAPNTTILSSVTSDDATVTTAVASVASAANPGEAYSLTTALDNKTLGSGDDQAFATDHATTPASDTFNVSDAVNGGAGDDTFYLTVANIGAGVTYTPSRITNFETLSITNVGGNGFTTDVSLMAPSAIDVSASSSAVNVTKVTAGSEITLTGNTAAVDIQHKNAGLTGSSDSVTVNLVGNTGGATIDSDGAQDIESATINATGVNSGSLVIGDNGGSTITSLTVGGTGSLAITAGDLATLTSVNAADNSGGVTYTTQVTAETVTLTGGSGNDTLTGNTGDDVITGGAGNDTLSSGSAGGDDHIDGGAGDDTITVAGITKDDTIAGGEGEDTLKINAALAYSTATNTNNAENVSGFEKLYVDTTLSQVMTPLSGITTLISGVGDVATLTKVDGISTVALLGAGSGADLTLASDGTADSLTVALGVASTQTNTSSSTLDIVEYETLTVSSAGADGNVVTVTADAVTDLTVLGDKNVTINLNPDTGVTTLPLTTIDASAATGTVNVQAASADSGVTVTPGSDALTVNLGDGADTVTGTAKADDITTGKGNDTVVGNGGDDTIDVGAGDDTVTLGDGTNGVTLGTGADTLTAGNGDNTVTNTSGNTTVTLGNGTNSVTNTAGNMTVVTGSGVDTITNTAGNADITSGAGNDVITNTAGNSTIDSGDGADSITLVAGNSNVDAGAGNDTIALGSGDDTVDGGDGTDTATLSQGAGSFSGSISNVESVTATMTASGTIDAANITGVTTLKVTSNDTAAAVTVKNIADGTTLNVSDDLAEDASNGDVQALTIDTVDSADMTLSILGNQETSIMAESDFGAVTISDVVGLTVVTEGGSNLDRTVQHTLTSLTADATETTSLTITAAAYGGLSTGALDGVDSIESLTITAGAAAVTATGAADEVDALAALTVSASGAGSVTMGEIGESAAAILSTISLEATSGGDIDLNEINSSTDMSSITITADGTGSTVDVGDSEVGIILGAGNDIGTYTVTASNGGAITLSDAEDIEAAEITSFKINANGTGSSVAWVAAANEAEAQVTSLEIGANGTASSIDITGASFGGELIDALDIDVASYATLTASDGTETALAFTSEAKMESLAIDIAANATVTTGDEADEQITVTASDYGSVSVDLNADNTLADAFLTITADNEAAGVESLTINVTSTSKAIGIDLEGTTLVTAATEGLVIMDDDTDAVMDIVAGSITVTTSGAATVDLGEASGTFSVITGAGGDTVTSADGNDTINTGAGTDTINIEAGGTDTITGGTGADDFVVKDRTSGVITITDFLTGTDDLSILTFGTDVNNAINTVSTAAAQGALEDNDTTVITLNASTTSATTSGTEKVADFEDITDVHAYLSERFTAAADDEALIVLTDGSDSYVYYFLEGDSTATLDADEITLVAVVQGVSDLSGDIT